MVSVAVDVAGQKHIMQIQPEVVRVVAHIAQGGKDIADLVDHKHIGQQKIDTAKSLLRTTTRDVREISDELSFSSPAYFGKAFRQQTGMPPTQFRQRQG